MTTITDTRHSSREWQDESGWHAECQCGWTGPHPYPTCGEAIHHYLALHSDHILICDHYA